MLTERESIKYVELYSADRQYSRRLMTSNVTKYVWLKLNVNNNFVINELRKMFQKSGLFWKIMNISALESFILFFSCVLNQ